MSKPRVEILYFDGCPNYERTRDMVERVAGELNVQPAIELVAVTDADAAAQLRFLGSPSVRVNGHDVEPGADERDQFVLACRIYGGMSGKPAEEWIREALRVADVLAAAGIPASKLGSARGVRLTTPERALYTWILHRFEEAGRPASSSVRAAAERLGLDHEQALATLAREDLVHRDADGEIVVAYPFSGRPTGHVVRFENGNEAYAMCAIDALGTAPMFAQAVSIASRDPVSNDAIEVRIDAGGEADWQPESAVVVAGALVHDADSCHGCCPVLNFFSSSENARRWLADHADVHGRTISMPDAIAAGRAVFGDALG